MRNVSTSYEPYTQIRDVDLSLSFSVKDENAKKENTVLSSEDKGVFSNLRTTVDGVFSPEGKYLTLEKNLWCLDGSMEALDEAERGETGFWSRSVSDCEGNFASPVTIQYTFPQAISTIGWILYFDKKSGQVATRVQVATYDGEGNLLQSAEFANDKETMEIFYIAENYQTVAFSFLATSEPCRRLRLMEVDFGMEKCYDRNSLGKVRLLYGADILCRALPAKELTFTFDNQDKQYNLLNPDGVYQHLQAGQEIRVAVLLNGEKVDMGPFYFTSADVSGSAIAPTVTAHDKLYFLDGDTFEEPDGCATTLSAAVQVILGQVKQAVAFDGDVGERAVVMAMPRGKTRRECLRLLAQAAMCTAYVDRDGVLRFCNLVPAAEENAALTADQLYDYNGVSIADPVDGVKLYVSGDLVLDEAGEKTRYTFKAGETTAGSRGVTFSNPCVAPENGDAVAAWLLAGVQRRKHYSVLNRCDPAVEIGDTLRISDIFDNRETAVITGLDITFETGLSAITEGVGA